MAFEDPAITYILRAMQTALSGRCAPSQLYDEALATALVSHLLSHYMVRPIKREHPPGACRWRAFAACWIISKRISARIRACANSRSRAAEPGPLRHPLPAEHRPAAAPLRARASCRAGERSPGAGSAVLAEIGYALGYTSQAHFITMFRRLTGMPPGAYRKLHGSISVGRGAVAYSGFREGP